MSAKIPIVLDGTGQLQQLQNTDDLQIPLTERVAALENKLDCLARVLVQEGFNLPDDLIENL